MSEDCDLITIGIPLYNMEKTIGNAIESCLVQTFSNIEILVVDDGSTDNSIEFIRKNFNDPRIRVYKRKTNGGVCSSMRDLVEQATGEYICFLDADDTMMPTRVEKQYRAIKSAETRYPTKMVASFCGSIVNDLQTGQKYKISPSDLWNVRAKHSFGGGTGHSMYKVSDLKKLGNFDLKFSRSADGAMCLTFLMNGGFYAMVKEPLITYNFYFDEQKRNVATKEMDVFNSLRDEIASENPTNLYLQRFLGTGKDNTAVESRIDDTTYKVKLFGCIPFFKIKRCAGKIRVYLFNCIPLIKIF